MEHFSYSIFMGLLHSLWQAPFLVCLYVLSDYFLKRNAPVYKRNLLFILLATQLLLTISTSVFYYNETISFYTDYIASTLSLVANLSYIEKISPWFLTGYVCVITFKIIQLIFNWQRFKIMGRTARIKPSVDLRLFTSVKAIELGIHKKVSLWCSNAISTPLTYGFFKPVILLPVALVNNLTITETETLILHELTHVKNNDYILNWLLIACEILFFFNPFIKILSNKIKLEREKNCDGQVLQFNYTSLSYAETLLKAARFKSSPSSFLLTAVFKNEQLRKRISFFTNEKNIFFNKRNYNGIAIVPLVAMFILNIFLIGIIKDKHSAGASVNHMTIVNQVRNNENPGERLSLKTSVNIQPDYTSAAKINKEMPVSGKKINPVKNKIIAKGSNEIATSLSVAPRLEDITTAVAFSDPVETKEITLKEENSATGKSVTKVFQTRFENGKWNTKLLWTITETKKFVSDSVVYLKDSTRYFNYTQ